MKKKNFSVLVDLQNDFINGSLGSQAARDIIPNIIKYVTENRSHIILTRDTHSENYLKTKEGLLLPVEHCIKNTEGWMINSDIMRAVEKSGFTYTIVDKRSFGTFDIEKIIRNLLFYVQTQEWMDYSKTDGKELNIDIMGLDTDICVISNALILRAAFPEADISVIENCCAGTTPQTHQAALDVMKACQIEIKSI